MSLLVQQDHYVANPQTPQLLRKVELKDMTCMCGANEKCLGFSLNRDVSFIRGCALYTIYCGLMKRCH